MEQCLVEHKHAISSWLMVRLTRDIMETVLKIETDLVLNAHNADFDGDAVRGLLARVQEYLRVNRHIASADIDPIVD